MHQSLGEYLKIGSHATIQAQTSKFNSARFTKIRLQEIIKIIKFIKVILKKSDLSCYLKKSISQTSLFLVRLVFKLTVASHLFEPVSQ